MTAIPAAAGLVYGALRGVVTAFVALPPRLQDIVAAGQPGSLDGLELAPEVRLALAVLNRFAGAPMETLEPAAARRQIASEARLFAGAEITMAAVENRSIAGPAGSLPVRIYRAHAPDATRPEPLVVYLHGGGWVTGDLDTHDPVCRYLAREARCVVMAVDYRLAPEHPFPAALDDAVAAFRWAVANAASLGVDASRIAVAGDSAGGNLSAAVAQATAADGGPAPALQVLIYPVTDLSTKHASYRTFADGYFLTEAQMDWYRSHYIGDADGSDPRVSPLLAAADDLAAVAPAYVTTAGFDVLRDEGEAYARRLEDAGVATTLVRHDGLIHGWVNAIALGHTPARAGAQLAAAVREGLAAAP